MKGTVFLGGGRITSALVAGLRLVKYRPPLVVYDRHPEKLRRLKRQFNVATEHDLARAVSQANLLIVAVRPHDVAGLLDETAKCDWAARPTLAVSLAAGIPLQRLRPKGSSALRWTRAMPSPVCRIARGLTAVTFEENVTVRQRKEIREFFGYLGPVLEIPETDFDAFTATFSPSHGYHALATLVRSAQAAGLDRNAALTAATHALAGGILYWQESGQTLDELLREAATPGGIAAATIAAMNRAGYERVVAKGLWTGIKQARINARR
jgi:pyrroline-5-carboxylate reductase